MKSTGALRLVMALGNFAFGERISFDTRSAWQEWAHPVGAVDLQATGAVGTYAVEGVSCGAVAWLALGGTDASECILT